MLSAFTRQQLATLRALVNRIIPADEFPAGWEGGVEGFLEQQLAGDLAATIDIYRAGLDALEAEALAAGVSFAELDPEAQDGVLAQVERGVVATVWPVDPATFFRMAVAHAAEGYYSDPGNGGNRDRESWRMIGYEVRG